MKDTGGSAFPLPHQILDMNDKFFKLSRNFSLIKEFRVETEDLKDENYKEKNLVSVSLFSPGDKVKVAGKSKGKGFQWKVAVRDIRTGRGQAFYGKFLEEALTEAEIYMGLIERV